jgi:hypothetical protein
MDNLLYLSYGQGPHVDQLVYAVLSALHVLGRDRNTYRIIVYTDSPAILSDLPVHIEPLSAEVLIEWAGPFEFNHRRKIFVIKDALEKFGGRLVYCDCDTYFLEHPGKLFARIRPGHTVMHIREGHLDDCHGSDIAVFLEDHNLRTIAGGRWNITPETPMFNAGVLGLHEADISLLDEVVYLTDQIYPHVRIHTIEQFAFSACFRQFTKLRQSYDIVHHYWPPPGRALFGEKLQRVFHDPSVSSQEERFRRLLPHQPRQSINHNRHFVTMRRRMYLAMRRMAHQLGVFNALKWVMARARICNQRTYHSHKSRKYSLISEEKSNKLMRDG